LLLMIEKTFLLLMIISFNIINYYTFLLFRESHKIIMGNNWFQQM
jgi:hypothetical protein